MAAAHRLLCGDGALLRWALLPVGLLPCAVGQVAAPAVTATLASPLHTHHPTHMQVKSDEHMARVKEQLLYEKQQIEATEQRCARLHSGAPP